jgi:hypothetical protein
MNATAKITTIISVRTIRFLVLPLRRRLDRWLCARATALFWLLTAEGEAKNLRRQLRQRNGCRPPKREKTSIMRALRDRRTSPLPQTGQVIMKDWPEFQLTVSQASPKRAGFPVPAGT